MGNDLVTYIHWLELIAFFSGYPLVYAMVYVIAGDKSKKTHSPAQRFTASLPFAYALTGTLYTAMLLKDLYPDYSSVRIADQFQYPYLVMLGISPVIFWIPVLSKKTIFSLLHSLLFFSLLLKDLFKYINSAIDKEMIQNDMKIYTTSLLINTATLLLIVLLVSLQQKISRNKRPLL